MTDLRIAPVDGDAMLQDWRYVHNTIIPTAALSLDEVRERVRRNRLAVAYLGDVLVGCSTVRPPTNDASVATVIARVLPAHRRQGFGGELFAQGLAQARKLGADLVETVVLASNVDGLRFAHARGFVEVDRYLLPGDSVPFIDLRLA
ncbi:GNAT family N-acetyltransferase [Streptomyces celluloflavus]|uniref:GNAT family N-acetyltransferase n=1 Tax=Streptomyces celluloflavus TaxID=58344 RepID=UPI0036DADF80